MKTLYIALCIGILAGLLSHGIVSAQTQYITTENVGHYTDSWVDITVSPFYSVNGQWATEKPYQHTFTVQNMRAVDGNLCLAYRFNEPLNYGKIYQNVISGVQSLKSYTCESPNTYNASAGVFYCWFTTVNGTLRLVYSHSFTGYTGNTAYWNETVYSENKIDRTEFIAMKQINGKYYYYATQPLAYTAYEVKQWGIEYIPAATDTSKKWDMILWGTVGSCDCITTDSCAFVSQFDPAWYNTTWQKCTNITLTENTGVKRVNYPVEINVSGLTFAATTEIRVTDAPCNMNGTEIPRDILDAGTGWAKILFIANVSKSNTTIYGLYHDAFGVSAPAYTTDLSSSNGSFLFLNNTNIKIKIEDDYAYLRSLTYLGTNWVGSATGGGLFLVGNYSAPWTIFGYMSTFKPNDCDLGFDGKVKKVISCRNLRNTSYRLNYTLYAYSDYVSMFVDVYTNYTGLIWYLKPEGSIGSTYTWDSGTADIEYSWSLRTMNEKWVTVYKTSPTKYSYVLWNGSNSRYNNGSAGININSSYFIDSPLEDSAYVYPSSYGVSITTDGSRTFFQPSNFIFGLTSVANATNSSEIYLAWYNPLNISFGVAGFSPLYITPNITTPNITTNISYTWDLGIELPVMQQYCSADGDSLVTLRGRYAYPAIGELFFVNQTEVFTCPYGCSDNSLLTLGQTSACRESNFTIGLITIVAVLLIVGIIKVSGK